VWLDEEKQLISVHQPRIETQLHSRLPGKLPIRIDRRVEWIVRGRNVVRERGRGNLRLRPVVLLERVREFLAGKPDLPRKQAIRLESLPAVFCDGGGIDARQRGVRKRAVMVELNEIFVFAGCNLRIQGAGVGYML